MSNIPALVNLSLDSGSFTITDRAAKTSRPCKDVLRQAIRVNRIRKGQTMPVIDKSSTVPQKRRKPLEGNIPEEAMLRRQKNREAAKKCRLKKRKVLETLQEKIDKYEDRNRTLEGDIKNFKDELSNLNRLLRLHKCRKDKQQRQRQEHVHVSDSRTSCQNTHLDVSPTTAVDDIADDIDDLLSELQGNDRWREELMQHM